MINMKELCERHAVKFDAPAVDARGRMVYKGEIGDAMTLIVVGREMVNAGCKPMAGVSKWNDSTVTLDERNKGECWFLKYYAKSREHAETVLDDLLSAIETHRQYQETFDL